MSSTLAKQRDRERGERRREEATLVVLRSNGCFQSATEHIQVDFKYKYALPKNNIVFI